MRMTKCLHQHDGQYKEEASDTATDRKGRHRTLTEGQTNNSTKRETPTCRGGGGCSCWIEDVRSVSTSPIGMKFNTNRMGGKGSDSMKGVVPSRSQMESRPIEYESIREQGR
jgi:hypothetical protein